MLFHTPSTQQSSPCHLAAKWDIDISLKFKRLKLLVSFMATTQASLTFPGSMDIISADQVSCWLSLSARSLQGHFRPQLLRKQICVGLVHLCALAWPCLLASLPVHVHSAGTWCLRCVQEGNLFRAEFCVLRILLPGHCQRSGFPRGHCQASGSPVHLQLTPVPGQVSLTGYWVSLCSTGYSGTGL